jgi:hypothetical protein
MTIEKSRNKTVLKHAKQVKIRPDMTELGETMEEKNTL